MTENSVDPAVSVTRGENGVATLVVNRPESRNALTEEVRASLREAITSCDADENIGCLVIAGSDEVFVAGADIRALRDRTVADAIGQPDLTSLWQTVAACRTPIVAAVSGYALGGGCELALACDMIVASETATFGQPEITLGIIPGGGGTQRLARVVGKQRAMELVLTGRRIDAHEALSMGFVNKVTAKTEWLGEAQELATVIARRPPLAVRLAKQALLSAEEMSMAAGLDYERRLFELTLATEDKTEGMTAFLEKRRPEFKGR